MWCITCSSKQKRVGRCFTTTGAIRRLSGYSRKRGARLHATLGLLCHAESLAPRRLAAKGWRPVTIHEMAHAHSYAAVASASPTVGEGHMYQGRIKSFPVEPNEYVLMVGHYVKRKPVRAGLAERAESWRWWVPAQQRITQRYDRSANTYTWRCPAQWASSSLLRSLRSVITWSSRCCSV